MQPAYRDLRNNACGNRRRINRFNSRVGGGRKKGHLRGQKERALARAKNGSGGSTDGPVDFVDRRRYKIVLDITST